MNIIDNGFAFESVDYQALDIMSNGNKTTDYALSIDFAKKLSMMTRTEKGEQARQYFIECEKQLLKPLSEIEILQRSLNLLFFQQKQLSEIATRVKAIEDKPQINAQVEHFSIMGYCHNIKKQISIGEAKAYGIKCRRMSNELGLVIGKVPDPRFGSVNTYPLDVLKEIIK